jgi:hypothetical protein
MPSSGRASSFSACGLRGSDRVLEAERAVDKDPIGYIIGFGRSWRWECASCGETGPDTDPSTRQPGAQTPLQAHWELAHGTVAELDAILVDLQAEVHRQDSVHPSGYPATRDGVRLGIATVEDEWREARDAWRAERCKCPTPLCGHATWQATEVELLQTAAVALRTIRSIREARA